MSGESKRLREEKQEATNLDGIFEVVSVGDEGLEVNLASRNERDGELVISSSVSKRPLNRGLLVRKSPHRDGDLGCAHSDLDVDTGLLDEEESAEIWRRRKSAERLVSHHANQEVTHPI